MKSLLISLVYLLFCANLPAQNIVHRYIAKYNGLITQLSQQYQIPYSIMMGIAIVESGAGTGRNCKLLKNHFGFVGKNQLSKNSTVKSKFKQYATDKDSFLDFCNKIAKKKYYTRLKGNDNYVAWVNAMSNAGYSEYPDVWRKMITNCIRKYKLGKEPQFDNNKYELQQKDSTVYHTDN